MVEADPFVPHRVPDGLGHHPHVAAAFVDEDHVEVGTGGELAPAVATHGHQAEPPEVTLSGVVEES